MDIETLLSNKKSDWTVTVCPRSNDPFYIVTYYIKWVTTSWTDGILNAVRQKRLHVVKERDCE